MSDDRLLRRAIEGWLADGPDEMPDRVLFAVADRIDRQPQRPAWRLHWRQPAMRNPFILLAGAAAVVAISAVVLLGQRSQPGVGGQPLSPSPTPSASAAPATSTPAASIACEDDIPGCAGPLTAGEHTSRQFEPALRFTVPAGWKNVVDATNVYKLDPEVTTGSYLIAWSQAVIADECTATAKPGLGHRVQDFIDYLMGHPGLETTEPTPIVRGAYQGQAIDIWTSATWDDGCPDPGIVGVQFILAGNNAAYWYGVGNAQRMHLEILDVSGDTVIFQVYGRADPVAFAADIAPARAIVESMTLGGG